MPITGYPDRPIVRQRIFNTLVNVGVNPTPISTDASLWQSYVNQFIVSVPTGGVNVFLGTAGVTVAGGGNPGIEIIAGAGGAAFPIIQGGRQLYEIQDPVMNIAAVAKCDIGQPQMIPFVGWDLNQVFLVATVAQPVAILYTVAEFV